MKSAPMVGIALGGVGVVWCACAIAELCLSVPLSATYQAKLSTPLFTAFLTISGFLLTLKTFSVTHLKEKLFDSDLYTVNYNQLCREAQSAGKPKPGRFDPLRNLHTALAVCGGMSLTTAILQLTLGMMSSPHLHWLCISFAMVTFWGVVYLWWLVQANLRTYLDYADHAPDKNAGL